MGRNLKRWTEASMMMQKVIYAVFTLILCLLAFPTTVLAANEKEGNNDSSSATSIAVNDPTYGSIANGEDSDWFVVSIEKDGYVTFQVDHPVISSTSVYWKMHLYQADGVTQICDGDTYWEITGNKNLKTAEIGLPKGTYCICIKPYSYYKYDTSTYTLKVNYKASSLWEKESNSEAAKASKIAVNKEYHGSVCGADDADWYTVTTSKDGYISVQLDHPVISTKDVYWKMYLYQSDGVTQFCDGDGYWEISGNKNLKTAEIGLPKGTYCIRIEPYSYYRYDTSTYTLKVNYSASSLWEKESNASRSKASKMTVNKEYHGSICEADDADWFVVTTPEDGCITFQFDHPVISTKDVYWKMYLYQSDGVTPIYGGDVYWEIAGNKNEKTAEIGLPKGTYCIRIEPYSYYRYNTSTYTMSANFAPSSTWEKEINKSASSATRIPLDQDVCGSICGEDDSDWYSFTLDVDARPTISFSHPSNGKNDTYWKMYLYQSDGVTPIYGEEYWEIVGNKDMKTPEIGLEKGTYYIRIEHNGSKKDTSTYTLQVGTKVKVEDAFNDISAGEWYVSAVQFVFDYGIMNGVDKTYFGPKGVLTREQFITVLYNMEGSPDITFKQIFIDVKNEAGVWYARSVTWAAENGITSGVGEGLFGTGKEITREQLATLLYNYATQNDQFKLAVGEDAIANFPDAGQVSDWAITGMKWAVTNGVMGGKTGNDGQNILDPLGKATRAECAQMIKNLKENAVK